VSEWEELTSGWPSLSNSNGIIDAILDCEALIKLKSEENVVSVGLCCWRGRDSEKSVARINVLISRETGKVATGEGKVTEAGSYILLRNNPDSTFFVFPSKSLSFSGQKAHHKPKAMLPLSRSEYAPIILFETRVSFPLLRGVPRMLHLPGKISGTSSLFTPKSNAISKEGIKQAKGDHLPFKFVCYVVSKVLVLGQ
jgi:hypothetical protein